MIGNGELVLNRNLANRFRACQDVKHESSDWHFSVDTFQIQADGASQQVQVFREPGGKVLRLVWPDITKFYILNAPKLPGRHAGLHSRMPLKNTRGNLSADDLTCESLRDRCGRPGGR